MGQGPQARLVETDDPDYFTLRDFKVAMRELREERKDEPEVTENSRPIGCLGRLESGIASL